jgi:integrase
MRGKITIETVKAMKSGDVISDGNPSGFMARRWESGKVSFFYRYRDKNTGKQHMIGLGQHGDITPARARELAQEHAGRVAGRVNPLSQQRKERAEAAKAAVADKNTVNAVLDAFEKRHASKLRSADQVAHAFDTYVRPEIGAVSVYDVRRRDIVRLLDKVEDKAGPVMADRTLAHLRKALNWWAVQDDDFASPIVKGMARTKPKELARDRILGDDEIRAIWKALDTAELPECFPRFVRSLLLCAARRNEMAFLHSAEMNGDKLTIPAARYKTKHDHVVPLTQQARAQIGDGTGFLFSTTGGRKGFSGFSKAKRALDAELPADMPPFTLHDLRRTARSLMSRAGVSEDHAERALGHVIGGVRGVYDRYEYLAEKRAAFEALAGLVDRILGEDEAR